MSSVYQKTVDDKCLILEPGEALIREMAIPSNWTDLILYVGLSFTTAVDENGVTATESVTNTGLLSRPLFGVKDGSSLAPGAAGSQFLGYATKHTDSASRYLTGSPAQVLGYDASPTGIATDGATYYHGYNIGNLYLATNESSDTNYFGWCLFRITRRAGAVSFYIIPDYSNRTDASHSAINTLIDSTPWSDAGGPAVDARSWDIKHFFFRMPFNTVRARIHNYGYKLIT